jgi:hypothetical protein
VLLKEVHTEKLINAWGTTVAELPTRPELVNTFPAISTFMAVKDEEELVRMSWRLFTSSWSQRISSFCCATFKWGYTQLTYGHLFIFGK